MTKQELEILKKMGFRRNDLGMYNHCLLDENFDIANIPIENIAYVVYSKGEQNGMSLIQEKIKNIIGIK